MAWKARVVATLGMFGMAYPTAAAAPPAMVAAARKAITRHLSDPASLQMRSLYVASATVNGQRKTILCGEFNSKNRMGGYVGYEGFLYEASDVQGVITFGGSYFSAGSAPSIVKDDLPESPVALQRIMAHLNVVQRQAGQYAPACSS